MQLHGNKAEEELDKTLSESMKAASGDKETIIPDNTQVESHFFGSAQMCSALNPQSPLCWL